MRNNQYKAINFKQLEFWRGSPRIPKSLQSMPKIENYVPHFLFNEDIEVIVSSMTARHGNSILGWFPTEPLNVIEASSCEETKYFIRDGNRRYIACWLILNYQHPSCPRYIREIAKSLSEDDFKKLKSEVWVITL